MGIAAAWATVSPFRLNRAAEASRPSLTIGEAALLSSVSSISSAMASSRLRSTARRMESRATVISSPQPGSDHGHDAQHVVEPALQNVGHDGAVHGVATVDQNIPKAHHVGAQLGRPG